MKSVTRYYVCMRKYLYILCGIAFSGKSTLAREISQHTGATYISRDNIFIELEKALKQKLKLKKLSQEDDDRIWKESFILVHTDIDKMLKNGKSVSYDDVNLTFSERELARKLALDNDAIPIIVHVDTPEPITRQRIIRNKETNERHQVSERNILEAINQFEPPSKSEKPIIFKYDDDLKIWLQALPH
jgi:predicted kinase